MDIKDKIVLYGRALIHLKTYIRGRQRAKVQGAKAKKLAKEHKRKMKYTDGLENVHDDFIGILAEEDCAILYDLGLISHQPSSLSEDLYKNLKKQYQKFFD